MNSVSMCRQVKLVIVLFAALVVGPFCSMRAQAAVPAVSDNVFVKSDEASKNYDDKTVLILGKARHSYIRISLDGLPSQIESAALEFTYSKGETKNQLVMCEAGEVLTDNGVETQERWTQGNLTWANRPLDVVGGWSSTQKADASLVVDVTSLVKETVSKGKTEVCIHLTTVAVDDNKTAAVEYKRNPKLVIKTGNEEEPVAVEQVRSLTGSYNDDAAVVQRYVKIRSTDGTYLKTNAQGGVATTNDARDASVFALYMTHFDSYTGNDSSDLEWAKDFCSFKDVVTGKFLTIQNYDEDGKPYYNEENGTYTIRADAPWINWNERFGLVYYPESDVYEIASHLNVYRDNLGYHDYPLFLDETLACSETGTATKFVFEEVNGADELEVRATVSGTSAILAWFAVNGDVDPAHYSAEGSSVSVGDDGVMTATVEGLSTGLHELTVTYSASGARQNDQVEIRIFNHPGIFQSEAQLDAMKGHIEQGEEPWMSDYLRLKNTVPNNMAGSDYEPQPLAATGRGENTPAGHEIATFEQGGNAAYFNALQWVITGDDAYAEAAVRTLNAWASELQIVDGRDRILGAGINGYRYINAAEIIRYYHGGYSGYSDADFAMFQDMCLNVLYPVIEDLGAPMYANGNWDTGALITLIGIGVVCDNEEIYDRAITMYQSPYVNGSIVNYISDWGQSVEAMRDQAHAQLGVGYMADVCMIAEHQGDDLWSLYDNRLAKAFNWAAQYNLYGNQDDPSFRVEPIADLFGRTQWKTLDEQTINRGELRSVYEAPLAHYSQVEGVDVTWMTRAAEAMRPQGYVHNDNLNFGTLTTYNGPIEDGPAEPYFQMRTRLEPWYQRTWNTVEQYGSSENKTVAETLNSYYAPDEVGSPINSARRANAPFYQLETLEDGSYALRCVSTGKYLSVTGERYGDQGDLVVAFAADEVGECEKFMFKSMGAGYYYLQAVGSEYAGRTIKTIVEGSADNPADATLRMVLSTLIPKTTTEITNEFRFEAIYATRDTALSGVELADTTELEELIERAEAVSNEDGLYTEDSFTHLQSALVSAYDVLDNARDAKADQVEVDKAANELKSAIDGLEWVTSDLPTDKGEGGAQAGDPGGASSGKLPATFDSGAAMTVAAIMFGLVGAIAIRAGIKKG